LVYHRYNSTNGTYINGIREPIQREKLRQGDTIYLGDYRLDSDRVFD